jgi:hypothetical protein
MTGPLFYRRANSRGIRLDWQKRRGLRGATPDDLPNQEGPALRTEPLAAHERGPEPAWLVRQPATDAESRRERLAAGAISVLNTAASAVRRK